MASMKQTGLMKSVFAKSGVWGNACFILFLFCVSIPVLCLCGVPAALLHSNIKHDPRASLLRFLRDVPLPTPIFVSSLALLVRVEQGQGIGAGGAQVRADVRILR